MDRLTVYIDGEAREDHSRDTGKWKNGSRECMARLAAYEDTGLTPEETAASAPRSSGCGRRAPPTRPTSRRGI
jgi:hypothetical protein